VLISGTTCGDGMLLLWLARRGTVGDSSMVFASEH
jgi:hypothetical protein